MAIKDSDAVDPSLSFENDIVPEFLASDSTAAGNRPHSLSEYYKEGGKVPTASPANDRIPLSGSISFHDFYGAVNQIVVNVANGVYDNSNNRSLVPGSPSGGYPQLNLYDLAQTSGGVTPVNDKIEVPVKFVFDATTRVRNLDIGGKFANLTIENNGMLFGEGGQGRGSGGSSGIRFNSDDVCDKVTIINNSGGYIAGGGNGGNNVSVGGSNLQDNIQAQTAGGGGAGGGIPIIFTSVGSYGARAQRSSTTQSTSKTNAASTLSITGASSNGYGTVQVLRGTSLISGVTVGQGSGGGGGGGRAAVAVRQVSGPDDQHARASDGAGGGSVFPAVVTPGANGTGGFNIFGLGAIDGEFGYGSATAGQGGAFGDANAIAGTGTYVTDFSYVNNGTFYGAVT